MVGGNTKKVECFPINNLSEVQNILGFHAFTACGTSYLSGYGKTKCWKVFEKRPHLFFGLGRDCSVQDVEEFICRLYGSPNPLAAVNQCRVDLFERGSKVLEKFPPTKDSLALRTRQDTSSGYKPAATGGCKWPMIL